MGLEGTVAIAVRDRILRRRGWPTQPTPPDPRRHQSFI
jgi:hypothetical protein